jgi:hypothetical protein
MFVDGNTPQPTLFVLMPVMNGHHPSENHIPTLLVDIPGGGEAQFPLVEPSHRVVRVGDFTESGRRTEMPEGLAAVSRYAQKVVDPTWFSVTPPTDVLAARFELPPGLEIKPEGRCAKLKLKGSLAGPETLYGLATVKDIHIDDSAVTIGPVRLSSKGNSRLKVRVVNLPQADIDEPDRPGGPNKDEAVPHFRAYYNLLKKPGGGPDLVVDDPKCGTPSSTGVDPYRCTVGFGCEQDPDC